MENIEAREVVNFGKSLIVPSVQELAKESITQIPSRYVRDNSDGSLPDRPVGESSALSVPVINLQRLLDVHGDSKDSELHKLHFACKEWGFFQVLVVPFITRYHVLNFMKTFVFSTFNEFNPIFRPGERHLTNVFNFKIKLKTYY